MDMDSKTFDIFLIARRFQIAVLRLGLDELRDIYDDALDMIIT